MEYNMTIDKMLKLYKILENKIDSKLCGNYNYGIYFQYKDYDFTLYYENQTIYADKTELNYNETSENIAYLLNIIFNDILLYNS